MLDSIRPKNRVIFAFLLIPIAVYVFAVFIPLLVAAYYSFFDWKGGPHKTFNGIENYLALINDSVFWQSFGHNIYLVAACIIGQIGLAFIIVMMINSRFVKFKLIHRTFGFFPSTISAVYIGFIWLMVYDYKRVSSTGLELIGKPEAVKVWLNEGSLVMLLISIPLIWQFIGYYMVIILSAISAIDKEIYEASELDGAVHFNKRFFVIIPLIKNTLLVCVTLCVAGNMKAFDHICVMTAGGPRK